MPACSAQCVNEMEGIEEVASFLAPVRMASWPQPHAIHGWHKHCATRGVKPTVS
jgi:hypothetical protein